MVIAAVFFVALAAGKWLAAWVAGRHYRFSRGEVAMMFSLAIAQAAATLASTLIGFKLGLFGEQIVDAVLLVFLVSLILTSLRVRRSLGAIEPEELTIKPIGGTILVPVMPSKRQESLVSTATDIAYRDAGVVLPVAVAPEYDLEKVRDEMEEWLKRAEECGTAAGVDLDGLLRIDSSIHHGVLRHINEQNPTLVLMEWSERLGVQDFLFGNVIDHIGVRSPVPSGVLFLDETEIERLVLIPRRDMKSTGYQVDLHVAAEIYTRLQLTWRMPALVLASEGMLPPDLQFDYDTEVRLIGRGVEGAGNELQPGDLVTVPGEVVHRIFGSGALRLLETEDGISVLVAAGPFRLNITSTEFGHETSAILSFGSGESQANPLG